MLNWTVENMTKVIMNNAISDTCSEKSMSKQMDLVMITIREFEEL